MHTRVRYCVNAYVTTYRFRRCKNHAITADILHGNIVRNTNAVGLCRTYFVETTCPMSISRSIIVIKYNYTCQSPDHTRCMLVVMCFARNGKTLSLHESIIMCAQLPIKCRAKWRPHGQRQCLCSMLVTCAIAFDRIRIDLSYHLCSLDARAQCSNLACEK